MFFRSSFLVGRACRVLSNRRVLAPLTALFFATGCHMPASHVAPAVSVRNEAFMPSAVSQVQASPLYLQARQSCKRRDYRTAADCLETLARTSGLAPEALIFVRQQRDICLRDAGLLSIAPASAEARLPDHTPANADCGPRALLLLCQKLGIQTNLEALRLSAGTTPQGTTLAGLQKAARKLGLQADGVQVSREALPGTALPAIAWMNRNHYVCLLGVKGSGDQGTAIIQDPNRKTEQTILQEQLLQHSSGYLLLVHQ